jgi:hypothetical protein
MSGKIARLILTLLQQKDLEEVPSKDLEYLFQSVYAFLLIWI